jgi:peptidyl-prolyl cis-trans isomerase C
MRLSVVFVLFSGSLLWCQNTKPAAAPASSAATQAPAAQASAPANKVFPLETVVATADGKKVTAGDVQKLIIALPGELQRNFLADRKQFLSQYMLLKKLAELAVQDKLDQQTPYKERLDHARVMVLYQALIDDRFGKVEATADESRKHYEANKDGYTQVRTKVIYIPFHASAQPSGTAKTLTEAEALQQATEAVAAARKGTDFVELVKKYSQDKTSAAKNGDFNTFKKSDQLPEVIKTALFALKTGGVTDPIRMANGFYVFRAEEVTQPPFEQIKDQVTQEVQQKKFKEWIDQTNKSLNFKVESEEYFSQQPSQPTPPSLQKKQ